MRVLVLLVLLWSGFSFGETSELDGLRSQADQGDATAQFILGVIYDSGIRVSEDDKEAVKWYRLAADQGYATAQNNLGGMYLNGEGVPEDKVAGYAC
ncbi:MAG: tetratricopeptide repeat protein [Candidatus Azotimanducaceae bacterium WSBS_2022_MAG_OTU7]